MGRYCAIRPVLKVNAWTVDNADTMRKLINLGVDFITTNEPGIAAGCHTRSK